MLVMYELQYQYFTKVSSYPCKGVNTPYYKLVFITQKIPCLTPNILLVLDIKIKIYKYHIKCNKTPQKFLTKLATPGAAFWFMCDFISV
jgi:hypothetical protein